VKILHVTRWIPGNASDLYPGARGQRAHRGDNCGIGARARDFEAIQEPRSKIQEYIGSNRLGYDNEMSPFAVSLYLGFWIFYFR
jgi:hypothetical protein